MQTHRAEPIAGGCCCDGRAKARKVEGVGAAVAEKQLAAVVAPRALVVVACVGMARHTQKTQGGFDL